MRRKIPATMATQHPDNAGKAFWLGRRYVDTRDEVKECFVSFSELGCEEFMWDWEGKYVDEAVVDRLLEDYFFFFSKRALGKDVFLTFRLPNIWQEKGYRIARALVGMITANDIAHDLGMYEPALFEAILPMTDDAKKLIFIQKHYRELALAFKHLGHVCTESMRIIPLIEDMRSMAGADALLEEYCRLHRQEFGADVDYVRPFIARSDPALNYGMVAAVLGAKIALHNIGAAAERLQVQMHPIIGVGSLPFRGHLSPSNVANYLREYAGIRTTTVQSALRYDYPPAEAKKAIEALNEGQDRRARMFDDDERRRIMQLIGVFTRNYQRTIERLSDYVNAFSERIPNRRERRVHAGLFGYSRSVAGKRLPRAIPFVATMYSLGVPPELVGTGRALRDAEKAHLLDTLLDAYKGIKGDLEEAGHYYNKDNLSWLAKANKAWAGVEKDVGFIEDSLGIKLWPAEVRHYVHKNTSSNVKLIYESGGDAKGEITRAAELRRSLG